MAEQKTIGAIFTQMLVELEKDLPQESTGRHLLYSHRVKIREAFDAAASAVWDEAVAKCIEAQQEAIDEAISEMNELAILGVKPMWNSLISRFDDLPEALRSLKLSDKTESDNG